MHNAEHCSRSDLKTAQVMRLAGVGRNTLRFYEEKGLISAAARTASGYRSYSAAVVEDLAFIKEAKNAGLPLDEIKNLLVIARTGDVTCGTVSRAIAPKLQEIDALVAKLELRKNFLLRFLSTCGSRPETARCAVRSKGLNVSACG
jgi:DNA-binding transcriptional MerR regulator